jgi:hypothetical protein
MGTLLLFHRNMHTYVEKILRPLTQLWSPKCAIQHRHAGERTKTKGEQMCSPLINESLNENQRLIAFVLLRSATILRAFSAS